MRMRAQTGFTLIEVIIVIAMMSILSAMAYYYLGDKGQRGQLRSASAELVSNMNLARVRAISEARPYTIQFNPGGNSYVLNGGPTPRSANLPQNVRFGSNQGMLNGVAVGDGVSFDDDKITFHSNGTCSESGVVYLTGAGGLTFAVSSFSATGRISVQRNDGSGWR